MKRHVRKVGVLGSGVMGSALAAHFANAGVPSLVLDIVPKDLTDGERAAGLTFEAGRWRVATELFYSWLQIMRPPATTSANEGFFNARAFVSYRVR